MTNETLSSKIWGNAIFTKDVKDFIQKLKVCLYKKYGINIETHLSICKEIDKLAGDDLIHSPQITTEESGRNPADVILPETEDTPDDEQVESTTKSSGTHGKKYKSFHCTVCQDFDYEPHDHGSDKIGCTNPKEIERIDKKYGRKLDKLCEKGLGRSKEARQVKKEWMEKIDGCHNQDCTNCGHHASYHVKDAGCFHTKLDKVKKRKNLIVNFEDVDCSCKKFVGCDKGDSAK